MTHTDEPPHRTCAVCARVLNSIVDQEDGSVTYMHALQDLPEDHPAVPVEPDEVQTEHQCDFCFMDKPVFVIPARAFEVPGQPGVMTGENWAACGACAALIDRNQWTGLLRRVAESWETRHGFQILPEARTSLGATYRALRKNINGSIRPIGE